jgi:hypothetical protein
MLALFTLWDKKVITLLPDPQGMGFYATKILNISDAELVHKGA